MIVPHSARFHQTRQQRTFDDKPAHDVMAACCGPLRNG